MRMILIRGRIFIPPLRSGVPGGIPTPGSPGSESGNICKKGQRHPEPVEAEQASRPVQQRVGQGGPGQEDQPQ